MNARKHIGLILLLASIIVALFSFKGYGISWDEAYQREIGLASYNFVFNNNQALFGYIYKDYGVAFELPLVIVENILRLTDSRQIFLMRHLLTHLFFLLGAYYFFKLIDSLYRSKLLASIGFLMLVLNPTLYAHSFFNTKDMPFVSMFIISLYLCKKFLDNKSLKHTLLLGASFGILINLRLMGALLPFITLIVLAREYRKNIFHTLILITTTIVVLYASWPFLWPDPIAHLAIAFQTMSKYPWDGSVLFNGTIQKATNISWNYIPVWFFITTPIVYLISGFFGAIMTLTSPKNNRDNLMHLTCFFTPVIMVILLGSVLYDGWRHLFFIYPPFVLLAMFGLNTLMKGTLKKIILIIVFMNFFSIGFFMKQNYPLAHVYFNEFLTFREPEYMRKNFDLDYWGVSSKPALEYILTHDTSFYLTVYIAGSPGANAVLILKPEDRARIRVVQSTESADYVITNFRNHPQDYEEYKGLSFHTLKVSNNTIGEIFKIK